MTSVDDVVDLAALVVNVEGELLADDRVPRRPEEVVQADLDLLRCRDHTRREGASRHSQSNCLEFGKKLRHEVSTCKGTEIQVCIVLLSVERALGLGLSFPYPLNEWSR